MFPLRRLLSAMDFYMNTLLCAQVRTTWFNSKERFLYLDFSHRFEVLLENGDVTFTPTNHIFNNLGTLIQ